MAENEKVRENRLRRMAARRGLFLRKSRRRDPDAIDFGAYWLVDLESNFLVYGDQWGTDLDGIEEYFGPDEQYVEGRLHEWVDDVPAGLEAGRWYPIFRGPYESRDQLVEESGEVFRLIVAEPRDAGFEASPEVSYVTVPRAWVETRPKVETAATT